MRHPSPWPVAITGSTLVACLALAGCSGEPPLPEVAASPFVGPAGAETPEHSVRLAGLLSLADIESETTTIDFAALDDGSFLGGGWSLEPTLGQAWGTGAGSSLTFHMIPPRELEIEIRCAPFHFPGSDRQVIEVEVNGRAVERIELWRMMRSYSIRVPADALRFGANELDLRYSFSASPAAVLEDSDDGRQLAVLFERLSFNGGGTAARAPQSSSDGTRLYLPFAGRVSYFLPLGPDSRLRLAGVAGWSEGGEGAAEGDWRLRLEATVDEGESLRIADLGPEQLGGPIEMELPSTSSRQLTRVSLAAFGSTATSREGFGLVLDLPEVLSDDPALAEFLSPAAPAVDLPAADARQRSNVLIYMIDTLRADHLGSYGYERATSPRIDAFAADATRFEKAIAQASWTKPSVVSIFTGLNPQLHGVNGRKDALAGEALTIAETLWEAGYDTAAIYTNGNLSHMGMGQGFKHYQHLREGTHRGIHQPSDRLHDEALRWLSRRDRAKPFFLYLHSTDPHSPYTPPEGYLERVGETVADPDVGLIENVRELKRDVLDESVRNDLVSLYDAEIAFNDEQFGRLIDELVRQGLYDSTMILVVSDHGEEFFDHGWWQHGKTLYQEQLGVPLVIRFPGGEGAGRVVGEIAQHIDLFPTILDVAGVPAPVALPGRSLRGDDRFCRARHADPRGLLCLPR